MLVAFFIAESVAMTPATCGTPGHLQTALSTPLDLIAPPSTDLVDQESHGEIPNVAYSDRFALKWGPDLALTDDETERILADFAFARDTQVLDWEMDDPTGYGGTFFNVYIGDSGGSVPSSLGNAGYYTLDGAGYPMIVLNRDYLTDEPYFRSVIAHEFFHAVQHAHEAFFYEDTGLWFWETTASWAAGRTVPESGAFYGFLPWYALQPQAGLYHHSLDEYGGLPPDLHQYGAFIFPWYISEVLLVPEAILAVWRTGEMSDDPLRVLESVLSETIVADAIAMHAARNLTWDYERGAEFAATVESWASHMAAQDQRFAPLIDHSEPDFFTIPEEHWPRAGGYALVQVPVDAVTPAGHITVKLAGDAAAAHPSAEPEAELAAVLVDLTVDGPRYHPIRRDLPHTNVWLDEGTEVWLAVANTGLLEDAFHPTPFMVSFAPLPGAPEPGDTGELEPSEPVDTGVPPAEDTAAPSGPEDYVVPEAKEEKASGCTAAPHPPSIWLLFLGAVAIRERTARRP